MQHLIRSLPNWAELTTVILLAFGYAIVSSIAVLFFGVVTGPPITSTHLKVLIFYEGSIFLALWSLLYVRGWTFDGLGFRPTIPGVAAGVGLAGAAIFLLWLFWMPIAVVFPGLHQAASSAGLVSKGLPLSLVVAVSLLNPLYEELFVCGYLITIVEKMKDLPTAVNVSVAIRLLYHLYQGPAGISLIPVGLVFALVYAKTRRLWPIVVAHGVMDFVALVAAG